MHSKLTFTYLLVAVTMYTYIEIDIIRLNIKFLNTCLIKIDGKGQFPEVHQKFSSDLRL